MKKVAVFPSWTLLYFKQPCNGTVITAVIILLSEDGTLPYSEVHFWCSDRFELFTTVYYLKEAYINWCHSSVPRITKTFKCSNRRHSGNKLKGLIHPNIVSTEFNWTNGDHITFSRTSTIHWLTIYRFPINTEGPSFRVPAVACFEAMAVARQNHWSKEMAYHWWKMLYFLYTLRINSLHLKKKKR
jgi:hypothetical protein